jgi:hypothetical protein
VYAVDGHWIGRRGSMQWPPRSPDLTQLIFFFYFWLFLNATVYQVKTQDTDNLNERITNASSHVTPRMLRFRRECDRRVRTCCQCNGAHIEHVS